MSDWPSFDTTRYCAIGTIEYANSRGTTIFTTSTNTKGSFAQLTPSTPFDTDLIGIHIGEGTGAGRVLLDIGIGPPNSETIVMSNLLGETTTASLKAHSYLFPLNVPAQSRITARLQSNVSSTGFNVAGFIVGGGLGNLSPYSRLKTYGATTSTSSGTSIDPGGTANVKGAWTQIAASTSEQTYQLYLTIGGQANDLRANTDWLIDVGVGSSGNEQVIVPNIPVGSTLNSDVIEPRTIGPFSVNIPAGSRLVARAQCSIIDATDRIFDLIFYGLS